MLPYNSSPSLLVDLSAEALTNRVLHELHSLEILPEEDMNGWWSKILSTLRFSVKVEKGCSIIKYYVLNIIKENWNNLPVDFRIPYEMEFDIFASRETGELSLGTIDNNMRAAKVFMQGNDYGIFGTVEVPERNEAGAIVVDAQGRPKTKRVEWNPADASMTKLVLVTPLAKDGTLKDRPDLLSMVMDSGTTADQLRRAIYGRPESTGNNNNTNRDIYYTLDGSLLVAWRNGESIEIAEIDYENYTDSDLAKDALDRLFSILTVKTDRQRLVDAAQGKAYG